MARNLVNLGLVLLVELWCGEESNPGNDEEGQHVEPGADVGQQPEGETELDGVDHVLHEEETTKFCGDLVDGAGDTCRHVGDGLRWDSDWHRLHHGERVGSWLGLLHHDHDVAVGLDTHHHQEQGVAGVGDHGDQGV